MTSPLRVLFAALLLGSTTPLAPDAPVGAFTFPEFWPSCVSSEQESCVELLEHTDPQGTTVAFASPGAPAAGSPAPDPYVQVMSVTASGGPGATPIRTVNFELVNPSDPVMGAGTYTGMDPGSYRFKIRLGTLDPSATGVSGDPSQVLALRQDDGTFTLEITAAPRPRIGVTESSMDECVRRSWDCTGEVGVLRNISGFVVEHPTASERSTVRGLWIATNASAFSSPQVSLAARTVSAQAAGPHLVPAGFPLDGLTLENGAGLNPAFYKAFVPYSVLSAMLDKAPAELKTYLTPETVKARITEISGDRDQPVTLSVTDAGVTVDLGLTHFSAPNPQIRFLAPTSTPAPGVDDTTTTPPAVTPPPTPPARTVTKGRTVPARGYVTVPRGWKVVRVKVAPASRRVCAAAGTSLKTLRTGSCSFTATIVKGKTSRTLKGGFRVVGSR